MVKWSVAGEVYSSWMLGQSTHTVVTALWKQFIQGKLEASCVACAQAVLGDWQTARKGFSETGSMY